VSSCARQDQRAEKDRGRRAVLGAWMTEEHWACSRTGGWVLLH